MSDKMDISLENLESTNIEENGDTKDEESSELEPVNFNSADLDDTHRYARLEIIPWWDQDKLRNAKVMVVGAGAIGNEVLKNLALLGVGTIVIVDMDDIEHSNLTRSILFREKDEGTNKAVAAAKAIMEINPDITATAINGNVIYDVGLGIFKEMDVVIGGLDNREARLMINRYCYLTGTPFIDGAIEVVHGNVKVFMPPETACYECTLNEMDFKLLAHRKSCALLNREEMELGKVPTTPTISSMIAGLEVQEFIKIIHQRKEFPSMAGKGIVFNGVLNEMYQIKYDIKEGCENHEPAPEIVPFKVSAKTTAISEVIDMAKVALGNDTVIDLGKDLGYNFCCKKCDEKLELIRFLGRIKEDEVKCSKCGEVMSFDMTSTIDGSEDFINLTLEQIGVPEYDIITLRNGLQMRSLLLANDKPDWLK